MFKKYTSLALAGLLLNLVFYSAAAAANLQTDASFAEKVKAKIAKLGTGDAVKVKIKLRDGTKLKGYISQIKDSGFVIVSQENGKESEIQYLQVKAAEGQNLSNGEKIFIRSFVIIGAILLYGLYLSHSSEY